MANIYSERMSAWTFRRDAFSRFLMRMCFLNILFAAAEVYFFKKKFWHGNYCRTF